MGIPYFTGGVILVGYLYAQSWLPSKYRLAESEGHPRLWLFILLSIFIIFLILALLPVFGLGRSRAKQLLKGSQDVLSEVAGDWIFVGGQQGTLYNGFRLVPVPMNNSECQVHVENAIVHPLGGEVLRCFFGIATKGPTAQNLQAGRRPPKTLMNPSHLAYDPIGLEPCFDAIFGHVFTPERPYRLKLSA